MHVTNEMLAADLRASGAKLRHVQLDTSWKFKFLQKLITAKCKDAQPSDSNIEVSTVGIPRRDGQILRLRVYRRVNSDAPATGLLWLHGGGYAFGLPEIENGTIERFIQTADSVVVAPDYRLSDEAPYPAALHDAYDALLWMQAHTRELRIRPNQLFVGGESAGGGLACGVAAYARDLGEVKIAFQIPLYPMLDDRMQTASAQDNDAPVWNTKSNVAAWKQYLGADYQTDAVAPYAAPGRLTDYSRLPPAFTFVGDIEPFYDETRLYFQHLERAGVAAECRVFPGAYHGFDVLAPTSGSAVTATTVLMQAYKQATERYFSEQLPQS